MISLLVLQWAVLNSRYILTASCIAAFFSTQTTLIRMPGSHQNREISTSIVCIGGQETLPFLAWCDETPTTPGTESFGKYEYPNKRQGFLGTGQIYGRENTTLQTRGPEAKALKTWAHVKKTTRASIIVAQFVGTSAAYIKVQVQVPAAPFPIQPAVNVPRRVAENGPTVKSEINSQFLALVWPSQNWLFHSTGERTSG